MPATLYRRNLRRKLAATDQPHGTKTANRADNPPYP
jgi:hypothetical protein